MINTKKAELYPKNYKKSMPLKITFYKKKN